MDELTQQVLARLNEVYISAEDFVLDMTIELAHDYLFLTRHFPVFFVLQSIWICVIVRRMAPSFKWFKSYLTSAFMAFLGRVVVALVTGRHAPLFDNPLYVPIFTAIWFLMNCSPFDLCHKIVTFPPFLFLYQFVYALIQVRETCHGVDIGLRAFPRSPVGAFLISAILSSSESFVWLLVGPESRDFGQCATLRNAAVAVSYLMLTQYPDRFEGIVVPEREMLKMIILGVYCGLVLLNNLIFGLRDPRGFDITLLTYLGKVFTYKGAKEIQWRGLVAKSAQ